MVLIHTSVRDEKAMKADDVDLDSSFGSKVVEQRLGTDATAYCNRTGRKATIPLTNNRSVK